MLPKPFRLREEKDFARVFRRGRSLPMGVLVFKNAFNSLPVSRFGIVVANSVLKKATDRNRTKRLVRAILLKYYKNIRPGFDIVIIGRKGIEKETFDTLNVLITRALHIIGIL